MNVSGSCSIPNLSSVQVAPAVNALKDATDMQAVLMEMLLASTAQVTGANLQSQGIGQALDVTA